VIQLGETNGLGTNSPRGLCSLVSRQLSVPDRLQNSCRKTPILRRLIPKKLGAESRAPDISLNVSLCPAMSRLSKVAILAIFNLMALALAFVILEGVSNTLVIAYKIFARSPLAERIHTEHDETLGWINVPNIYIEDMYGPGIYLKTNGQRFRNDRVFSLDPPPNKIRLICSGDSFTLGYGVDNDHTWCQQLVSINEGLETVNMGQGGYGVDQAYLWYKRDGTKLNHDIQIFAFITSDFNRMRHKVFQGYGKPVLVIRDDSLVMQNVPIPAPYFYTFWINRHRPTINELNSIKILRRFFFQQPPVTTGQDDYPTQAVVSEIFQDLHRLHQATNSVLVAVYLPTKEDYGGNRSAPWQQFLQAETTKQDLLFIDLIDEFRKLPPQTIESLFIPRGAVDFEGSAGHYTEKGNTYIAQILYEKLLTIPEISGRLSRLEQVLNGAAGSCCTEKVNAGSGHTDTVELLKKAGEKE